MSIPDAAIADRPHVEERTATADDASAECVAREALNRMRVVQVHSADSGGGAEATARLHHEELRRHGHDSRLLVARRKLGGPGIEQLEFVRGPKGVLRTARWLERHTGLQYLYAPGFRRALAKLPAECDVVHLHSLHGADGYADIGPIAALSQRCPVAMTIHDLWPITGHCGYPLDCTRWQIGCGGCPDLQRYPAVAHDATRLNWWRKRMAFRKARLHLIVPSHWVADQLRRSPILGHLPVTVVHAPIETEKFRPGDRAAARQRLGLPVDRKIVLLTAQSLNNVYKGTPAGIDTLNQVNERELFIVAIGNDAEAVLAQCQASGVAVKYQSDQGALADYYRAADLLLMPSQCETFGMVAAEAMACGTPVVAFAAGGLTDVVGKDEGGLLLPVGDVTSLAAAVRRLLRDDALCAALGRIGADRAAREFSLESHTQRCVSVYERLIAERRAERN